MAQVYLAIQEGIGGFEKTVVVKRIFSHLCESERFVQMFLDEARLAASVHHQNVVQIYDIGEDDEGYFIVMEYLSGETVALIAQTLSRQKRFVPTHIACRIGASVAAGLHHAHTAVDVDGNPKPMVHRDVTPSNLIVCFNGAVKIVDFGIAKATESADETSDAAAVKGKLSYLSPEMVRHQHLDGRTDVFQLGIVLHEMLCGRRLFNARTNHQKIMAVLDRKILPPSAFNKSVPEYIDEIVLAALERDPNHRIQTADELRRRLEGALKRMSESIGDHELGDWLRATFPKAHADRMAIERDAVTAARKSSKIIETSRLSTQDDSERFNRETSREAAIRGVAKAAERAAAREAAKAAARVRAQAKARAIDREADKPPFEIESTPSANGQVTERRTSGENVRIAALLASRADGSAQADDSAVEQSTVDIPKDALDQVIGQSEAVAPRRRWPALALFLVLLIGATGLLIARSSASDDKADVKSSFAHSTKRADDSTADLVAKRAVRPATQAEDRKQTDVDAERKPFGTPVVGQSLDRSDKQSAQAAASYRIDVVAVPETATITLDDTESVIGELHKRMPMDQETHTVVISASGYVTRTLTFSAEQRPPSVIRLVRRRAKRASITAKDARRLPKSADDNADSRPVRAGNNATPSSDDGKALPKKPATDNIDPWAE